MMQQTDFSSDINPFVISMFGGFSIQSGNQQIQETVARTHQLWHLMEYLIAHRHKEVSQQELIQVLWPEGNSDNPANALKNLVYRVRSTLNAYGLPHAKEMVVYRRGGYRWNNGLPCIVDTEEFERIDRQAEDNHLEEEQRICCYRQMVQLYKGDFLPGARYEDWVLPLSNHYRTRYFRCVYALLDALLQRSEYLEIETVCKHAIHIDPFEEPVHRFLILALIHQGRREQAMRHYNETTDLFFRELGVSPSPAMHALYRDLAKTTLDTRANLSIVQEELKENDGGIRGAFYCEYEVFKHLYRLEVRAAARSGQPIFVSLITVENPQGDPLDIKLQNKVMDNLFKIIQGSLRKGDVYTRLSACQYIVMLSALTFENCESAMDRVVKRFHSMHRNRNVRVSSETLPMDLPVLSR